VGNARPTGYWLIIAGHSSLSRRVGIAHKSIIASIRLIFGGEKAEVNPAILLMERLSVTNDCEGLAFAERTVGNPSKCYELLAQSRFGLWAVPTLRLAAYYG
jgi:hypothetical protein